ncbi:hypothetical protein [Photobacterium leiognathi]|uniref:hypothetical protein n=1 Tax=Photobacterium leiognathi TaxID=553611 RepID=UPI002981D39F|nr:hypothetical protein [Photobacterium leiognathi]
MGFQFARDGIVDIAPRSLKKLMDNIQRLYEQGPNRVAEYLTRSLKWLMYGFENGVNGRLLPTNSPLSAGSQSDGNLSTGDPETT